MNSRFLDFPGDMQGVADALRNEERFNRYPWIVYGETHRKLHLGFNGEDVNLSLDWYASGWSAGSFSEAPQIRVMLSLAQKRNPVPRAKGQRSKDYRIWIPAKHEERYFDWDKTPVELPRVLLTMFSREQKERLRAAYAQVAEVFEPAIEHQELHGDISSYEEAVGLDDDLLRDLTESEKINEILVGERPLTDEEVNNPQTKFQKYVNQHMDEAYWEQMKQMGDD